MAVGFKADPASPRGKADTREPGCHASHERLL